MRPIQPPRFDAASTGSARSSNTIGASAAFGAICGSSIATAATMSKVAYPSMKRLGYSDSLSTGVMASGGTLGIMIPPSTIMVIYGIITETHIGKLFAAGVIPGILTALLMMGAVVIMTSRDPEHAPAGEKFSWSERMAALRGRHRPPRERLAGRFRLAHRGRGDPRAPLDLGGLGGTRVRHGSHKHAVQSPLSDAASPRLTRLPIRVAHSGD